MMKLSEPKAERLHRFFVRVFTTDDLFAEDLRQEMRLESLGLDDMVAQLEAVVQTVKDFKNMDWEFADKNQGKALWRWGIVLSALAILESGENE